MTSRGIADRAKILSFIDENKDSIISDLKELVRKPSLTGEELCGQEWIIKKWGNMGLSLDVWEPDVEELFDKFPTMAQYPSSWQQELDLPLKFEDKCTYEQLSRSKFAGVLTYKGRPNVVGIKKGQGGGCSLILNGHIDVVTVGDSNDWIYGPFSAHIENRRLYGRGACDMKGGLIAMTAALEAIIRSGIRLDGDVILQSVVNEEHSGNGTMACVARGYTADAAICAEPSGSQKFSVDSGGGIYWEISVFGREVHAGKRWKEGDLNGVSAIEKMSIVIDELIRMESQVNSSEKILSLGMGLISGGSYATSTAAKCVLSGVCYFSSALGLGETGLKKIKKFLGGAITASAQRDPWLGRHLPKLTFSHYTAAYRWSEKNELVEILKAAGKEINDLELKSVTFSASDAARLGNMQEIPCIVYGPGEIEVAHSVNEYVEEDEVIRATKTLALTIHGWSC